MTIILFDQFWYTDPDPGQAALKMKAMKADCWPGGFYLFYPRHYLWSIRKLHDHDSRKFVRQLKTATRQH